MLYSQWPDLPDTANQKGDYCIIVRVGIGPIACFFCSAVSVPINGEPFFAPAKNSVTKFSLRKMLAVCPHENAVIIRNVLYRPHYLFISHMMTPRLGTEVSRLPLMVWPVWSSP